MNREHIKIIQYRIESSRAEPSNSKIDDVLSSTAERRSRIGGRATINHSQNSYQEGLDVCYLLSFDNSDSDSCVLYRVCSSSHNDK